MDIASASAFDKDCEKRCFDNEFGITRTKRHPPPRSSLTFVALPYSFTLLPLVQNHSHRPDIQSIQPRHSQASTTRERLHPSILGACSPPRKSTAPSRPDRSTPCSPTQPPQFEALKFKFLDDIWPRSGSTHRGRVVGYFLRVFIWFVVFR